MREKVREEEERDTTTHLTKIHAFTYASRVTKFSMCSFTEVYTKNDEQVNKPWV